MGVDHLLSTCIHVFSSVRYYYFCSSDDVTVLVHTLGLCQIVQNICKPMHNDLETKQYGHFSNMVIIRRVKIKIIVLKLHNFYKYFQSEGRIQTQPWENNSEPIF